jgi:hypothetical protein
MPVEFIARVTCDSCGQSTDVEAYPVCCQGGWDSASTATIEHDDPGGWTTYESVKCHDCWANNKSPRSPEGEGGQG